MYKFEVTNEFKVNGKIETSSFIINKVNDADVFKKNVIDSYILLCKTSNVDAFFTQGDDMFVLFYDHFSKYQISKTYKLI